MLEYNLVVSTSMMNSIKDSNCPLPLFFSKAIDLKGQCLPIAKKIMLKLAHCEPVTRVS